MDEKTELFIKKAILKHGKNFSYENVIYVNNKEKVSITCLQHGKFEQTPNDHLKGRGCSQCWIESKRDSKEAFIKKANAIHNSTYIYKKTKYINNSTKIIITCPKHGDFIQYPSNHLSGNGCPCCKKSRLTTKDFVLKARSVHGDIYSYDKVDYTENNNCDVIIICPKHGDFKQTAKVHLSGCGCPGCRASKGEKGISAFLLKHKVFFETQKTFENCKGRFSKLRFDFFLPEFNICIEYDGLQHFTPVNFFGGTKTFEIQKKHDEIKTKYCKDHNVELIRIAYYENIEDKLCFLKK